MSAQFTNRGKHARPQTDQITADASAAPEPSEDKSVAQEGSQGLNEPMPMTPVDQRYVGGARRGRRNKVARRVFGIIGGILAIAYLVGIIVFSNWFFPNTTVGGIDASWKSSEEVQADIDEAVANYAVSVSGSGFVYRTTADDAGVTVDSRTITDAMHAALPAWQWPYLIAQSSYDATDLLLSNYNAANLEADVLAAVEQFNETATPPTNASIAFDDTANCFVVTPEAVGTQLDAQVVCERIERAITTLETDVVLDGNAYIQPTVFSDDERLAAAADTANTMAKVDLSLSMNGIDAGRISGKDITNWIVLDENLNVVCDQEALNAWVDEKVNGFNTVGTERSYTRSDGKFITVSGGDYGWKIDTEALRTAILDGITNGTVGEVEIACISTGVAYNGPGQPDWNNRYAEIDLTEQHARFYDDTGALVWESDVITGVGSDPYKATPTGVYDINSKSTNETLRTYERGESEPHETVVKYWMPFIGNLIAFHDAWWQPGFGGNMYNEGYGSHGCINLPTDKAAELYDIIHVGDVVVVHW